MPMIDTFAFFAFRSAAESVFSENGFLSDPVNEVLPRYFSATGPSQSTFCDGCAVRSV